MATLGEELLAFYQPDNAFKVEDILPDLQVPLPDREAEIDELRGRIRAALEVIPAGQRRRLLSRYVPGLEPEDLASSLGRPRTEVQSLITAARQALRRAIDKAPSPRRARAHIA